MVIKYVECIKLLYHLKNGNNTVHLCGDFIQRLHSNTTRYHLFVKYLMSYSRVFHYVPYLISTKCPQSPVPIFKKTYYENTKKEISMQSFENVSLTQKCICELRKKISKDCLLLSVLIIM
jgi:hypothetical protein